MSTALLLIDVQQSFVHRPYWSENDLPAFLAKANALIQGAMAQGIPIVRVFHVDGPNVADNHFSIASGSVRPLDGLAPFDAALTVEKHPQRAGGNRPAGLAPSARHQAADRGRHPHRAMLRDDDAARER